MLYEKQANSYSRKSAKPHCYALSRCDSRFRLYYDVGSIHIDHGAEGSLCKTFCSLKACHLAKAKQNLDTEPFLPSAVLGLVSLLGDWSEDCREVLRASS